MKTTLILAVALFAAYCLNSAIAQDASQDEPTLQYRVLQFEELFKGDEAAMAKVDQVTFSPTYSDGSEFRYGSVRRIDMDAEDYEKALNRLAKQGWKLESVTKANYWIFSKR